MNVAVIDRSALLHHIRTIEARYPLRVLGFVPAEEVRHVEGGADVAFFVEKAGDLSLIELAGAENELTDLLGRRIGLLLRLTDRPDPLEDCVRPL
jgi:predicted nucleotidyltransferase